MFTYQNYRIIREHDGVRLIFNFDLANQFLFQPEIFIPHRFFFNEEANDDLLHNLAFHIGMVELISYWKLSCAPVVEIQPHILSLNQIQWWKKLYFNGLGEFFYVNGIETNIHDFMDIRTSGKTLPPASPYNGNGETIVPVGGGKDSVVSLGLLLKANRKIRPMIINPRRASSECARIAGFDESNTIIVERTLDPLLLQLNKEGFLNGHTPFSAMLAFVAAYTAVSANFSYIALSNESSASEATVPGTEINHQYSKSIDFEQDFREYIAEHIAPGLEYFSLLRPLNELQIASLFSKMTAYHGVFKSCNVGSKTDSWCCNCPKCLFTWIMLMPFLEQTQLQHIFGENLAEKISLQPVLSSLLGETSSKPFECVGTVDEVQAAVMVQTLKERPGSLFETWKEKDTNASLIQQNLQQHLQKTDAAHFLPPAFETILRRALP